MGLRGGLKRNQNRTEMVAWGCRIFPFERGSSDLLENMWKMFLGVAVTRRLLPDLWGPQFGPLQRTRN